MATGVIARPDRILDLRQGSSRTNALVHPCANDVRAGNNLNLHRSARLAYPFDIVMLVDTVVDVDGAVAVDVYAVGIAAVELVACVAAVAVRACHPCRPTTIALVLFLVANTGAATGCQNVEAADFPFRLRFLLSPVWAVCRADQLDQ